MIDWAKAQAALARAGFACGKPDGHDGPLTYTALFAFAAGRFPDATILALGRAGAAWLAGDAVSQTPQRLAEFIAQCANETGGFAFFEEDLRYSATALCRQWPEHFTPAQAAACVGRPIEIASRAYGGRMGNDPYPSKDGWTYRGRGMLQLTGKSAYAACGPVVGMDLIAQPDLASDPADSLVIAREFWRRGKVNAAIDAGDFAVARKITNGGSIGIAAVALRRAAILTILKGDKA